MKGREWSSKREAIVWFLGVGKLLHSRPSLHAIIDLKKNASHRTTTLVPIAERTRPT